MPGKQRSKPRVTRREKKAQVSSLVQTANTAEDVLCQLQEWTRFKKDGLDLKIEYKTSKNLTPEEMDQTFNLLKKNMENLYVNSDWGWNETEKKKELVEENARFLLAKNCDGNIMAFTHFRFDVEVNQPILYCYELQVAEEIQRKGLGKFLMNVLFVISFQFKLTKVMLTLFTHNTVGIDFYTKSLAFRRDETCPYEEEEKCYVILCKFIDKSDIDSIQNKMNACSL